MWACVNIIFVVDWQWYRKHYFCHHWWPFFRIKVLIGPDRLYSTVKIDIVIKTYCYFDTVVTGHSMTQNVCIASFCRMFSFGRKGASQWKCLSIYQSHWSSGRNSLLLFVMFLLAGFSISLSHIRTFKFLMAALYCIDKKCHFEVLHQVVRVSSHFSVVLWVLSLIRS